IVGLEAHGAHVASALASLQVGALALVDPFPIREGHLPLIPALPDLPLGASRARALTDVLSRVSPRTHIEDRGALGRSDMESLASDCDLIVSAVDRGFSAANLWVNRAALARGIPAIYGQIAGNLAFAGP